MGSSHGSEAGPAPTDVPDFQSSVYWLAHPKHYPDRVRSALPKAYVTLEPGVPLKDSARSELHLEDCQESAPADVFYLHGTMEGRGNRASIKKYEVESWKGFNTHHQMKMVTAFTGSCRAYAPLYRQCAIFGDWDLAYQDVLAAFEQYLAENPEPRPLILAGHSQGSMHLSRLVKERVATDAAVLARVAGVYAPGAALWFEGSPLPFDDGVGAVGPSVAMWATVAPAAKLSMTLVGHMARGQPLAPFVPLSSWTSAGHGGALIQDDDKEAVVCRGLIDKTEVVDKLLRLHPTAQGGEVLKTMGGNDFHAHDIHLFWEDIRERVRTQVAAYVERGASKEAEPRSPSASRPALGSA